MRRAISSWRDTGLQPSSRPQRTSVGQAISASNCVASRRASSARCCASKTAGGLALEHAQDRLDERLSFKPFGMDHAADPPPSHRTHTAAARQLDELHALDPLPLTGVVRRPGLVAGVEQGKPAYAVARTSEYIESDAPPIECPTRTKSPGAPSRTASAIADRESRTP